MQIGLSSNSQLSTYLQRVHSKAPPIFIEINRDLLLQLSPAHHQWFLSLQPWSCTSRQLGTPLSIGTQQSLNACHTMPCLETTQLRAQPTETGLNCQNAGVSGEDRITSVAGKNMFKSVKNINYWDIPNHLSWWTFKIIFIIFKFCFKKESHASLVLLVLGRHEQYLFIPDQVPMTGPKKWYHPHLA